MAYSEALAHRVRQLTSSELELAELTMFGGLAYTLHGNMALGVLNDDLIVRVPRDQTELYLNRPGARDFDFTGRPMRGFVVVESKAIGDDNTLRAWVEIGLSTSRALPPRTEKPPRARVARQ